MLERLNDEQLARLATKREEWLKVGLNTETANRAEAERGVRLAYQAAGLAPPAMMVWLKSPLEGCHAAAMFKSDQVWDQVRGQVRGQVRDQVWDQVWDQVRGQVGDQVWDQVRGQVRDQVWDQVRGQVGDQVWDQVWGQVGDQVWEAVCSQHEAGWLSFFDFFSQELECVGKLEGLITVARNAGWWWPFEGVCILTERPVELHRDPEHRLHNERGMAIRYPDGFGVWAINGVRVNEQIVMRPDTLTVEQITDEPNAEVRRVMRQQYGYDKYLDAVGAELIDDDSEWGKLWHANLPSEDEPLCLVEVINSTPELDGTYKTYFLRVPPGMETAHDAVAWTFTDDVGTALTAENYLPEVQT